MFGRELSAEGTTMNEQDIETVVLEEDYIKKTFKHYRLDELNRYDREIRLVGQRVPDGGRAPEGSQQDKARQYPRSPWAPRQTAES